MGESEYDFHLVVPAASLREVIGVGSIDLPSTSEGLSCAPWLDVAAGSARIDAEWLIRSDPFRRFTASRTPASFGETSLVGQLGPHPAEAELRMLDGQEIRPISLDELGNRAVRTERRALSATHAGIALAADDRQVLISYLVSWVPTLAALIPLEAFDFDHDILPEHAARCRLTTRESDESTRTSQQRTAAMERAGRLTTSRSRWRRTGCRFTL